MLIIILSLILGSLVYKLLRKVYYETKATSATFAIILFLGSTIAISLLITPKTIQTKNIRLEQLLRKEDIKSNNEIVTSLEQAIEDGKDTLIVRILHYRYNKGHYMYIPYPVKALDRLRNTHKISYNETKKKQTLVDPDSRIH